MFMNEAFQRAAKAARFVAVAGILAASIPAAFAEGSSGGGGGGGGGGSGGSGDGRGNAVLHCLGPDCINVSRAQVPPCTSAYCKEEEKKIEVKAHDSCEVRVCDIENGQRVCWTEVSLDERICIKHKS